MEDKAAHYAPKGSPLRQRSPSYSPSRNITPRHEDVKRKDRARPVLDTRPTYEPFKVDTSPIRVFNSPERTPKYHSPKRYAYNNYMVPEAGSTLTQSWNMQECMREKARIEM